jgi:DNA-binding SARP family transcriptional activator
VVERGSADVVAASRRPTGRPAVVLSTAARASERHLSQLSSAVSFGLLGSLEVLVDRRTLTIPGGRQRTLLAMLLLRANETVSVRELVESLWDDVQPANPKSTVQKYVMRLRRLLEPTGCAIRTDAEGYRLEVGHEQVDVHRFSALAQRGRRLIDAGDRAEGSAVLADAIGLWRAVPPLANVPSERMQRDVVPRMVEGYLQVVELRIEADLQFGRHAELCEELLGLVRRHPLRERFWEQRMRALYACHRQGEALAAYREVARLLADELGIDPGPALQSVHQGILSGAPASAPAIESQATVPVRRELRQLPMATSGVVGRTAEVTRVVQALSPLAPEGRPRLVVVHGPEGIGKSTVALRAAHRLAAAFPDGQLYADLGGGADPEGRVAEVVAYFLRSLGVPADAVPSGFEDAVAAFRSATAGRRLLVVLDGAPSASAVRAALPGSSGCGVIVTSRHELAELFVSPGARGVSLGPLRWEDAHRVLRQELGDERLRAEPDAVDELLRLCDGLPLAIRSAAAHLVTRPRLPIASYLAKACPGDAVAGPSTGGPCRLVPVAPAQAC